MRRFIAIVVIVIGGMLAASHLLGFSGTALERAMSDYVRYKQEYASKSFSEQHLAAHKMGASLYEKLGVAGFQVCDESFAFGCYHAFFGGAIADRGLDVISELAQACKKRYGQNSTGCEHGIGHGLMENLGHDKLVQALELCDKTDQKDPLYGCSSGAFMEYNDAVTLPNGSAVTQKRAPEPDLRAPCTTIPEKYRTSCYFEIALWWKDVLGDDYARVGNLCLSAEKPDERAACSRGWGTVVAENVAYDPDRAITICGLIKNKDIAEECSLGVAQRFFGSGRYAKEASEICERLTAGHAESCRTLDVSR